MELWLQPVGESREGSRFANMRKVANPGDSSFESEPESRMRNGAVSADIQIPGVNLRGKSLLLNGGFENG